MEVEENRLIGRYVKLKKKYSDLHEEMMKFIGIEGKFKKALRVEYPDIEETEEREFQAMMSVKPDSLASVIVEFRKVRVEYEKTYKDLRDFKRGYPDIVKRYE